MWFSKISPAIAPELITAISCVVLDALGHEGIVWLELFNISVEPIPDQKGEKHGARHQHNQPTNYGHIDTTDPC